MSVAASFCAPWTLQTRWAGPFHQLRPPMIMSAEGSQPRRRRRPSRPKKQSSQFERSVDDLVGKRMGRGYIYYGERTGGRAGEEADAVAAAEAASAAETGQLSDEEFLKDDAILVAGGCGRTGQWITLGLVNQGFNVRVLTRDFDRAEKLFGPSGSNVDVFQGDVGSPDTLVDALDGAAGLAIAVSPEWWRPGGPDAVEGQGALALVQAAAASNSVRRIVYISGAASAGGGGARTARSKLVEDELQRCGVPFVVIRTPMLNDSQGGMSNILLEQGENISGSGSVGSLTRVDAAQIVCQAFVYDRFMKEMDCTDPGSFLFGDIVVEASNGDQPSIVDKRYWKNAFSKLKEEGESSLDGLGDNFEAENTAET